MSNEICFPKICSHRLEHEMACLISYIFRVIACENRDVHKWCNVTELSANF